MARDASCAFFVLVLPPLCPLPRFALLAMFGAIAVAASSASAQVGVRPRVRAVVLQRDAVFDSTEARFWAYRLANTLHVETRPNVPTMGR